MESEINISGRIIPKNLEKFKSEFPHKVIVVSGHSISVQIKPCCLDEQGNPQKALASVSFVNCNLEEMSDKDIAQVCEELSVKFDCLVYIVRDQEFYGVANVYNGGSDYEVVNEKCFLCAYERGLEILREHTNCWNEKARSMEQAFLESEISTKLLNI